MISAPLTVTNSGQSWVLTTDEIGQYMDFKSQDVNGVSTLVPYFSADKLAPFLDEIAPKVANPAVDAKFGQDGTKAWVVPAVLGEELGAGIVDDVLQLGRHAGERDYGHPVYLEQHAGRAADAVEQRRAPLWQTPDMPPELAQFWYVTYHTLFWIDPKNKLTAVFFTQYQPFGKVPAHKAFRDAVYESVDPSALAPK